MNKKNIKFNIEEINTLIKNMKRENLNYWDFADIKELSNFNMEQIIEIEKHFKKIKKEVLKND